MLSDLDTLQELLKINIPREEPPHEGFLEIISQSTKETINSRLYGYFLDSESSPETTSVFIRALLEVVKEKNKFFEIEDFRVRLEYPTKIGRIDIVLENLESKRVIIIENKLYHFLNNPLDDYWFTFDYPEEQKLGIVLTLFPDAMDQDGSHNYINILHIDWINKIEEIGLPDDLPINKQIYLTDFISTIKSLSNPKHMNELTTFYFDHTDKVLAASKALSEARNFMNQQILAIAGGLGFEIHDLGGGKNEYWVNFWKNDESSEWYRTYYTLSYATLMKGDLEVTLILEFSHDHVDYPKRLENTNIPKLALKHGLFISDHYQGNIRHYLAKVVKFTKDDLENLHELILTTISESFEPVAKEINKYIREDKQSKSNSN